MAGSLAIRLTQTDPDETRNIALNPFVESLFSVLHGTHSVAGVKAFYNMTAEDGTDFDTLVGKVTSTLDLTERIVRIHRIRSILTFWERRRWCRATGTGWRWRGAGMGLGVESNDKFDYGDEYSTWRGL